MGALPRLRLAPTRPQLSSRIAGYQFSVRGFFEDVAGHIPFGSMNVWTRCLKDTGKDPIKQDEIHCVLQGCWEVEFEAKFHVGGVFCYAEGGTACLADPARCGG